MAREAGLEVCTEEVIAKDDLMRSLGFGRTIKLRPADENEKPKTALFTDHEPEPAEKKPQSGSGASWFVPGSGQIELGAAERFPRLPQTSKPGKKSGKGGGGKGSPFATNGPIDPGSIVAAENSDDVLIVPSSQAPAAPKSAFSDEIPPPVIDAEEQP
jgi:hypothetical protein